MRVRLAATLSNPISAFGVALTTSSAILFLALFFLHLLGFIQTPYAGILVFILVPALFIVGLLIIPIGLWRVRRKEAASAAVRWPRIDLNDPTQRNLVMLVGAATLANIAILSMASYGAVDYSESQAFCGQVCHTVMEPEFVAHQSGAHGRVQCVQCHIGPGAGGFVTAKLNGTRQLWLVATGSYPRPIPTPVVNLPDVRTTCERCHVPDRFVGDRGRVLYDHSNDASNKETRTTVRVHIGGPVSGSGNGLGIHWHMNRANEVEYVARDDQREEISYIRVRAPDGRVREFFADGVNQAQVAAQPRRRMDCLDCHNRPAHTFGSSPDREIDAAIGEGRISSAIPFIRREAIRALTGNYTTQEEGVREIDRRIRAAVSALLPRTYEEADLRRAIGVTQAIYRTNVFPTMKVGWGTYPNQLGHTMSTGCFRCHDENHKTREGGAISQDCELCHAIE